jgi:hypothetical protein
MQNVAIEIKGNNVVLTFDATKDLGRSSSGKTTMVATTSGSKKIVVGNREISIGLNAFTK